MSRKVAELSCTEDKYKCSKQCKKQKKNTDIYLNKDVSSLTLAIRKKKLSELKRKRSEALIAFLRVLTSLLVPELKLIQVLLH